MSKANLLLKNDVGLVLDITESPLACTVYDLEGNVISGSGGGDELSYCDVLLVNNTGYVVTGYCDPAPKDGLISNNYDIGTLANGGTMTVKIYSYEDGESNGGFVSLLKGTTPPSYPTVTASDAVNCSFDGSNPEYPTVIITEPGSSSITLTLS